MLRLKIGKFYLVKSGQTLSEIAETLGTTEFLLVKANGLTEEPFAGQLLSVPAVRGNLYTVTERDTKRLLCGSEADYEEKNGRSIYLGGRVLL